MTFTHQYSLSDKIIITVYVITTKKQNTLQLNTFEER